MFLFYESLPIDLKESFKKILQKGAYVLANKKRSDEDKFKIVEECHSIPQKSSKKFKISFSLTQKIAEKKGEGYCSYRINSHKFNSS